MVADRLIDPTMMMTDLVVLLGKKNPEWLASWLANTLLEPLPYYGGVVMKCDVCDVSRTMSGFLPRMIYCYCGQRYELKGRGNF